nr:hypothetical protein [Tanacetum cinerariifolium]
FVLEFEHPEDLVLAEEEAPASLLPPGFLSPLLAEEEAPVSLLPPGFLSPRPTMDHGVDCSYVETRLRDTERRMMATLESVNLRVSYQRLAYEHEGIQTREALARSKAYCRALEARVAVLETHARRLEWLRQAADDFAVQHIMRTLALKAGARDDTLEDT